MVVEKILKKDLFSEMRGKKERKEIKTNKNESRFEEMERKTTGAERAE